MNKLKKITYLPNNGHLKIPSREEFHRRFSGIVYKSDYDAPTSLTAIAGRIASNIKFDETCKTYIELRENNKPKNN